MPPPNPRSENVCPSGAKPTSLEMVSHQVCCCILPLLQPHRNGAVPHAYPQHSSLMVPSCPLKSCSSNRASDGCALEINGIIVGNRNEFKEVSTIARVAYADVRVQYTVWCKTCLDESDFHMVGGGKFVVKVRLRPRVRVPLRVPLPRHPSLYPPPRTPLRNPDGANSAPRRACPTNFERTT